MTQAVPRLRKRVSAVLLLSLAVTASATTAGRARSVQTSGPSAAGANVASVLSYGATGDDVTDDTAAIQRANDDVAAAGGGTVLFPAGVYTASDIRQDSFVEFRGMEGAVLEHGGRGSWIIQSRLRSTTGSVVKGSKTVTVQNASAFTPGSVIAIRGAGGGSKTQVAGTSAAIGATSTEISLGNAFGFSTTANYLLVGNEIVSYQSIVDRTAYGVRRGLYGTKAEPHPTYTQISQLLVHYSRLTALTKTKLTIADAAPFGVSNVVVYSGTRGTAIRDLEIDGNRQADGSAVPQAIQYALADSGEITGNTFHDAEGGAIRLDRGTRGVTIAGNTFRDNGGAGDAGAAVWLFRGANGNTVRTNDITGQTSNGVFADDRTVASTEWDRGSNANLVEGNVIDFPAVSGNSAVGIFGSSDNVVRSNTLRGTWYSVRIFTTNQSRLKVETARNVVEDNSMTGHKIGVWADGTYNRATSNTMTSVTTRYVDQGTGNQLGP